MGEAITPLARAASNLETGTRTYSPKGEMNPSVSRYVADLGRCNRMADTNDGIQSVRLGCIRLTANKPLSSL